MSYSGLSPAPAETVVVASPDLIDQALVIRGDALFHRRQSPEVIGINSKLQYHESFSHLPIHTYFIYPYITKKIRNPILSTPRVSTHQHLLGGADSAFRNYV
jgi:hypothetical protein